MRRKNIENRQKALWREAVRGAAVYVLIQLLTALALLWLRKLTEGWLDSLLLVLAVLDLAAIPPVFMVLRQRSKEIQGGELDAAGKY